MPDADVPAGTRAQFDAMTEMLGLHLPPDRTASIFQGFLALRAMTADLRRPRDAAAEPAGTFVPASIARRAAP